MDKKNIVYIWFSVFTFFVAPLFVFGKSEELVCNYKGSYTYEKYEEKKTDSVEIKCVFYDNNTAKCSINKSGFDQPITNWSNYTHILNAKSYYMEHKTCFPYMVFVDKTSIFNRYEVLAADNYGNAEAYSAYMKSKNKNSYTGIISNTDLSNDELSVLYEHLDAYIGQLNKFKTKDDPWDLDECLDDAGNLNARKSNYSVCVNRLQAMYKALNDWETEVKKAIDDGVVSRNNSKVQEFYNAIARVRGGVNDVSDEGLYKEPVIPSDDNNPGKNETDGSQKNEGNKDIDYDTNDSVSDITVGTLCASNNLKKPLKYIGWLLTALKVVIPILIIAMGAVDFFKVITSAKGDEVPKALRSLAMRVITGIVIFFIPALIHFIFSLVDDWSNYNTHYSECTKCLYNPKSC